MDYVSSVRNSVETAVSIGIFSTKELSAIAHIEKSTLVKVPMSIFTNVDNFNPDRLQISAVKAYPLTDRPRGADDISSVKYQQKQIGAGKELPAIWLFKRGKKYTLLDGAHRIVAYHIEKVKHIYAYVIHM